MAFPPDSLHLCFTFILGAGNLLSSKREVEEVPRSWSSETPGLKLTNAQTSPAFGLGYVTERVVLPDAVPPAPEGSAFTPPGPLIIQWVFTGGGASGDKAKDWAWLSSEV